MDLASGQNLTTMAAGEIEKLIADGINPTLDELIWLNDLAREVVVSGGCANPSGWPCRAADVVLWPWTIAGAIWYERVARWFDDRPLMAVVCLSYALAHGRKRGAFDDMLTYRECNRALEKWASQITATGEELERAASVVMAAHLNVPELVEDEPEDPDAPPPQPSDYTEIIAAVRDTFGGPADEWMCDVSKEHVMRHAYLLSEMSRGDGDKAPRSELAPDIRATQALGRAVVHLRKKYGDRT